MSVGLIKVKTLLFTERNGTEIFVSEAFDPVKGDTYYRPIGGTVEFGESTIDALKREIQEETGKDVIIDKLLRVYENMFVCEGRKGHEIVFLYRGKFSDDELENLEEFWLIESNHQHIRCSWISKETFKSGALRLVPEELVDLL